MNAPKAAAALLLTATLAAALTACGGDDGATPSPSAPTGQQMAPGSGSASPVPPTGTPTGTIDPSMAAYRTACNFLANQVTAAVQKGADKGAVREYPIVLTESSATPCSLTKLAAVTLLDSAGKTIATAKPGTAGGPVVVNDTTPAQFTLTTPRESATRAVAKVKITLPHEGGTREIDANGMKVDPADVTVGPFSTRGTGG